MRKSLVLILTLSLVFSIALMTACGTSDDAADDTAAEAETVVTTERSVDAIAEACGLSGKDEVYYSMIGAADGASFADGTVEVYLYDDQDADEYQGFATGSGMYGTAYVNDGAVLVFLDGVEPDQDVVDAFSGLVFE